MAEGRGTLLVGQCLHNAIRIRLYIEMVTSAKVCTISGIKNKLKEVKEMDKYCIGIEYIGTLKRN